MECQYTEQRLSNYLEGRLGRRETERIGAHLEQCAACRRRREAILDAEASLRELPALPLPAGARSRLIDRWLDERRAPRAGWRWRTPERRLAHPAVAAAALALAALGLGLARWMATAPSRRPGPSPTTGASLASAPDLGRGTGPGHRDRALSAPSGTGAPRVHPRVSGPRRSGVAVAPWPGTAHGVPRKGGRTVPLAGIGPLLPTRAGQREQGTARRPPAVVPDDLAYLNSEPQAILRQWARVRPDEWTRIEARVRRTVRVRDDFVRIPFPQIASTSPRLIAEAVESYKKEAANVDPRLSQEVTLAVKAMAFSDLCDRLRADTGIEISAGPSVADEKVTIFCEKKPLREVMREINHLFGFTWLRSGKGGHYRYDLDEDLKSQLTEEELRNRDRDAAVLALDREMQKYRPYVSMSYDELRTLAKVGGETGKFLSDVVDTPRWAGMQLYFRLRPADRTALVSGDELVFRPDAPNPDRRLPAEWSRPLLMCAGPGVSFNGRHTELVDLPAACVPQVRLQMYRSERGQLSLAVRMTVTWNGDSGEAWFYNERLLATGRSPSVAYPDNARANTALRGRPPLDRVLSLEVNPSCPAVKMPPPADLDPDLDRALRSLDRSRPYALSSDVWEAIHRATGLPIIADFYTRLYPLDKLTIQRRPLFDVLCAAGDALGARWTTDGGYLLCRSTSYFWDKLSEVPNRYLQRWAHDRDASGGLPFADFLEMATMSDKQLDSAAVAQGIEHFWGLREWVHLGSSPEPWMRQHARFLTTLTPEQLRRVLQPQGLSFKDLTPAQQQGMLGVYQVETEALERQGSRTMPAAAVQKITATYIPAGWYAARVPGHKYVGGRTADEAAAAARRLYPGFSPPEVRRADDGYCFAFLTYFFSKG